MEVFIPLILIPCLVLAFAVLTNLYREHRKYHFELKPNCLLTRKPVVFLTGPRSVFYFRKYWNAYPEILAEHGYEVFTLPLPWRGEERKSRMQEFLNKQTELKKKYHFVTDAFTANELSELFEHTGSVASITILGDHHESPFTDQARISYLLGFSYKLHSWLYRHQAIPSANDVALHYPTASRWLLQEMQLRGEQDFLA